MTSEEEKKAKEMKRDAVLGRVNLALLHYAGYVDAEIAALGDLSEVPEAKMQELVRKKAMKASAEYIAESGVEFESFRKADKA